MTIDQLTIYIENEEGRLAELTSALAREGIDIRAMSVADMQDFGVLRLIVSDCDRAVAIFKDMGCAATVTQVLAVAIPDAPGSLAKVSQLLADEHISIDYMYAFVTRHHEAAYVVFRVNDNKAASEILTQNGFVLAAPADITAL